MFLYFTNATFISACVFFIGLKYPMSSWSILIASVLNCASDRLLITISFSSFSGVLFSLSFWIYFFVSSCWQPPCVGFCVLGGAALTPCLSILVKLYGAEPLVIARVGQHMLPLCCSMYRRVCQGEMPLPDIWSFVQEEAVSPLTLHFLPICHWCHFSCCPGAEP